MISTPNATLSVTGKKAWQGTDKSNGILMLGDSVPHIEISFSALELGDGLPDLDLPYVPFGNALWYSADDIADGVYGKVYGAKQGDTSYCAGILKYVQGADIAFTMNRLDGFQNGVMPHMKGTLIKEGYVWYKKVYDGILGYNFIDFDDITLDMCLFVSAANGLPVLVKPTGNAANGVPTIDGGVFIGSISLLEPENESVLIKVDTTTFPIAETTTTEE